MIRTKTIYIILTLEVLLSVVVLYYFVKPESEKTEFQSTMRQSESKGLKTISFRHGHIRYSGRFQYRGDDCAVFAHAGSTIEWTFTGQNCVIILRNYSTDPKTYSSNYFYAFIDDREPVIMHVVNDSSIYRFSDLGEGMHHFRLFKRTEAACGKCEFVGIMIDEDATLYQTTVFPRLKIEFIGNSITAGYGNEDSLASAPFKPATQNHYYSYAAVCARLVGGSQAADGPR